MAKRTKDKEPGQPADLMLQTFGKLRVVRATSGIAPDGSPFWQCRCLCGQFTIASQKSLRGGKVRSCGCGNSARSVNYDAMMASIMNNRFFKLNESYSRGDEDDE